jgi:hypothetical protein
MVKTAMRTMNAVRDGRDRLMDAIFGVREAGACIAPDPWCGCIGLARYGCCHFNCRGESVCFDTPMPFGYYCTGPRG